MSVELDWDLLDSSLCSTVVETLNNLLQTASLPPYVGPITVTDFGFGDSAPAVTVRDITDVYHDFTAPDDEDVGVVPPYHQSQAGQAESSSSTANISLQLHVRTQYTGSLRVVLKTTLLVNYPSPLFMALPLNLNLTSLNFDATWIVAFEGDARRVHISLTPPPNDGADPDVSMPGEETPASRMLRGLKCDPSEVGDADKHVLRNVGKVDKFVLELVRGLLESELVWPNYQTIYF